MSEVQTYNHINFLPNWYVCARRQRNSNRRQVLLVLLMLAGMITLWLLTRTRLTDYELYYASLQQQINAVGGRTAEVAKLQNAREDLARQARIYDRLARPVTYTHLADTIGAITPEAIFLTVMNVNTDKSTRTRTLPETDQVTNSPKTVTETYEVINISMEGVAPTNVEIANYVGRLASSNLFRNVKMLQSRQGRMDSAMTRTFEISMEIPLDRAYEFTPAQEEVADAN